MIRRAFLPSLYHVKPFKYFAISHVPKDNFNKAKDIMEDAQRFLEYGETNLAMEAYQSALKLHPSSSAHYNIGNIYFQLGKFNDARQSWFKAIEMDPKQSDAYVNLGNMELIVEKNPEGAIKNYKEACELDPNDGELLFNLGVAYDKNGNLEEAFKCYTEAEEILKRNGSKAARLESVQAIIRNAKIRLKIVEKK